MATIQAKRWVTTSLTLLAAGIYTVDLTGINFSDLEVDGVPGSVKTTDLVGGDDLYKYYLDLANNQLQIRLDASDIVDLKNFVIFYVLAFTNDHDLYWNIDPDSPNTRKILFESRMQGRPNFAQSQENNLVGILSMSITSFQLDNTDQQLNQYFTSRNSLRESKLKVWKCNELPSSREPIYIGYVAQISISETVIVTVNDFLKVLDKPMYSFDNYFDSLSGSLAGVSLGKVETPICRLYGRNTSFKLLYKPVLGAYQQANCETMPEAICTTYNPALATNVNRVWATGIIEDMSGYLDTYTIDSSTLVAINGNDYYQIGVTSGQDDFTTGDTFILTHAAVDYYCIAVFVEAGAFYTPHLFPVPIVGDTIKMHKVSCMAMKVEGVNTTLYYGRDYTVNADVAGSPISITLVNGCETAIGKISPIDPASETLHYKLRNNSGLAAYSHGAQIKKLLLESFTAGELDTDSFDDADTAKSLDLNFQVPFVGEAFITKKELLQKLLASSFGYLYVTSSFKIAYGNYSLPAAESFDDITDIEAEEQSISHDIDYLDVYYKVRFSNQQFEDYWEVTDSEAQYLHGASSVYEFIHVCDVSSAVKPIAHFVEVANFFSTPKIISSFTAMEFDVRIGQRKTLNSQKALGDARGTIVSTSEGDIRNAASMAIVEESEGVKYYSDSSGILIEV